MKQAIKKEEAQRKGSFISHTVQMKRSLECSTAWTVFANLYPTRFRWNGTILNASQQASRYLYPTRFRWNLQFKFSYNYRLTHLYPTRFRWNIHNKISNETSKAHLYPTRFRWNTDQILFSRSNLTKFISHTVQMKRSIQRR